MKQDDKNLPLANHLLDSMLLLREEVLEDGLKIFKRWEKSIVNQSFINSAKNLSFYLALRQRDIRELQDDLQHFGLSSLGRLESRTMDTINAVIFSLGKITNRTTANIGYPTQESFLAGKNQLSENSKIVFGENPKNRHPKIMVTLPPKASDDYEFVEDLIAKGMNVARINCAHDGPDIWLKIIENIRKAEKKLDKSCKVLMDIAGPKARINWVFQSERSNRVQVGDIFLLTSENNIDATHEINTILGCSLPEILEYLQIGSAVLIDDGSIESEVTEIRDDGVLLKINKVTNKRGIRLRADKGINFPKTNVEIESVTDKDRKDLDFIVQHADILGCSFVKSTDDIELVLKELDARLGQEKGSQFPIMAKIETVQGVENLPEIIITAAGRNPFSVMIARGDLAVESGYVRLAELQQEILWICEAADIPAVWATQVLDNLVSTGIPTRAEVTDIAEGGSRAECVMLNKGSYLADAVTFLDQVLEAMEEHQYKKTSRLRALSVAKGVD